MGFYEVLFFVFFSILLFYIFYHIYLFLTIDVRYRLYKLKTFSGYKVLNRYFPLYKKVPPNLKRNLHACILTFIKNKEFIGVGIDIDDSKKVLIAANACILTMGLDRCEYKHLKTIILYPDTIVKDESFTNGYVVSKERVFLLGEAVRGGSVILSWKDLVEGDLIENDGKNVGFHEFAHQLDLEDGVADGTPNLPFRLYSRWSVVMSKEFKRVKNIYKKRKSYIIDRYAITNEAEFFAVVTELFFEKPKELKKMEPSLYEILKEYYNLDPIYW